MKFIRIDLTLRQKTGVGIGFLTPARREIHLTGGSESLTFYLDGPSKNEVDKFIFELKTRTKKVLLDNDESIALVKESKRYNPSGIRFKERRVQNQKVLK